MINDFDIVKTLFDYPNFQQQIIPELKDYNFKNIDIKEIIDKIYKYNKEYGNLEKKDFYYLEKENNEKIKLYNDILNKEQEKLNTEIFLKNLTKQIKENKLNKLKEEIAKSNIKDFEYLHQKTKEINEFNLYVDDEFTSFKDVQKVKKLEEIQKEGSFLTGCEYIDQYVKDSDGFYKGSLNVFIGMPHTGKCVVGNTKILIEDFNNNTEFIEIKDLFLKEYINNKNKINNHKKFIEKGKLKNNLYVWTNNGFKEINYILKTIPYEVYRITLDDGNILECADEHILATLEGLRKVNELVEYQSTIYTDKLFSLVIKIEKLNKKENMYDIQIKEELQKIKYEDKFKDLKIGDYLKGRNNHELFEVKDINKNEILVDFSSHLYYTNNILSHNTLFLTTVTSAAIKKKKKILYLSFELPENEILKRIYVNFFGKRMKTISKELDEVETILNNISDNVGETFVKEYPSSTFTPSQLDLLLTKLKDRFDNKTSDFFPDILVIDQLTTMGSDLKGVQPYEKGKDNIEKVKAILQKFKIIGFSAAQANRDTTKSKDGVQMDNVAESWGIPQIADLCFGALTNKSSIKGSYYELEITCFKNRLTGNMVNSTWAVDKQKMNFVDREL